MTPNQLEQIRTNGGFDAFVNANDGQAFSADNLYGLVKDGLVGFDELPVFRWQDYLDENMAARSNGNGAQATDEADRWETERNAILDKATWELKTLVDGLPADTHLFIATMNPGGFSIGSTLPRERRAIGLAIMAETELNKLTGRE